MSIEVIHALEHFLLQKDRIQELSPSLNYKLNRFVYLEDGQFKYYFIKLSEEDCDNLGFIKILRPPSVLKDGYVCYKRNFYPLSKFDIFKGRLNVRSDRAISTKSLAERLLNQRNAEPRTELGDSVSKPTEAPVLSDKQHGLVELAECQIKDLDISQLEYLETLQFLSDTEEEKWF